MNKEFEFDGNKYKKASAHQKEWGNKIISEFRFKGNEKILGSLPQLGQILSSENLRICLEKTERS